MKFFLTLLSGVLLLSACQDPKESTDTLIAEAEVPEVEPVLKYGFDLNEYEVVEDTIRSGDTFGEMLEKHEIKANVLEAAGALEDVFNVRGLRAGKPYKILRQRDSAATPAAFIYDKSDLNYVVLEMQDSLHAYEESHPVTERREMITGVITSNLWNAIAESGKDYRVFWKLEDIYQWSLDFHRLQKGDRFKIIYKQNYINDSIQSNITKVEAAVFKMDDKPFYAFHYDTDTINKVGDFYDENGKTLRSFFLKAPVKYTRISSRFTRRRFHPVQKRWKAHKGTDYAAPYHTPIVATANGVVSKSGFTRGNGNYVKIKHSDKYSTQYLHMTKRKVKVGQRVKQGDIIGTVGSTGLATGPHVCYRFWVNGVQRDPYRQNLPTAEPLKPELMDDYLEYIVPLQSEIDSLEYKTEPST